MAGLYQSGWNPPGVRKSWERCSMSADSTHAYLANWNATVGGTVREAA